MNAPAPAANGQPGDHGQKLNRRTGPQAARRRPQGLRAAARGQRPKDQPPLRIDVATFGAAAGSCARNLTGSGAGAGAVTGRLVHCECDDHATRRSRHPPSSRTGRCQVSPSRPSVRRHWG